MNEREIVFKHKETKRLSEQTHRQRFRKDETEITFLLFAL